MRRLQSMTLSFLVISLTCGSVARAQYWGGYHSSTVGEANARGLGALIRDQGEANLLNAQAAGEFEKARAQYLTNSVDAVQAYYDRKRVREAYYSQKKEDDKAALQRTIARRGTIGTPTDKDVNPKTGEINWPSLLTIARYSDYRNKYQTLFAQHVSSGALTGEQYMDAQNLSRQWRQQLGKDREEFDTNQVKQAIHFILSLDKELTQT